MLGARFGPALFEEGASKYWMVAVFGPMLCCLLILIWWLTASRATWRERLFGFLGIIAAAALTAFLFALFLKRRYDVAVVFLTLMVVLLTETGGPASWHLLYPGGGRNHNVIGNSWNCPRASFGDLGLGTASRGQMAEAG